MGWQRGHWITHPQATRRLTGDFNHDGTSDVFWFNPTTGDTDMWKIVNGKWAGSTTIGLHPLGWQPAGAGDFNHDGTDDVLWFNPTTRNTEVWKVSEWPMGRQRRHRRASGGLHARRRR